ncbi:TPA: hypothetical protein ACGO2N_002044 [Streptococcus suis]
MTVNKNFVTFSKGIVQALEYPVHVLVAFNKDTKVMGIQVCRAKTRGAFCFSKPVGEQKGIVQVGHKNLKETLLTIMSEWKSDKRYRVEGIHIPEDKAFVFELKDFEELSDFRKNDNK